MHEKTGPHAESVIDSISYRHLTESHLHDKTRNMCFSENTHHVMRHVMSGAAGGNEDVDACLERRTIVQSGDASGGKSAMESD